MDFKLRYFRYPLGIWRTHRGLKRSQWFDPELIQAGQWSALRGVLDWAYQEVPYYRGLFDQVGAHPQDIKTWTDFRQLPILTKQQVRDHVSELTCRDRRGLHPVLSRTGGTTGTALWFYVDRLANIMEFAIVLRHWGWAGYRLGERFCDLRGRIIRSGKPWVYDPRLNALFLSSYRLTRDLVSAYARRLKRFRPKLLRGYPSSIYIFAKLLREKGIDDIRPAAVVTSSETLWPHQRQTLEDVFGCRVFDTYGLEERCCEAGQCPEGGLHVDAEYGVFEVLDPDGNPVGPGGSGEVIGTGLHSRIMPFVRYRTGDRAELAEQPCGCGRGLPTLKAIVGRTEDMVITPDGRYVPGSGLSVAIKRSTGIRLSQILQERPEQMVIKVVRSPRYNEEDEQRLVANLRDRVGEAIDVRIEYVEEIPLTAHGKFQFVVSSVKPDV